MRETVRYAVGCDATVDRLMEISRAEGREEMRRELMARQSPTFADFNPTGDERVARIKGKADDLIALVRETTEGSGPETKRRAALAATNIEQGAMWAVKALFSGDAIKGEQPDAP
jgi:hypothetical protein